MELQRHPYQNAALAPNERADDLLSRMTLEEKAAQMMCIWNGKADMLVDADGRFDLEKAAKAFADGHGIGQIGRPSDAGPGGRSDDAAGDFSADGAVARGPMHGGGLGPRAHAELTNAIQRFFLEESRLGIPVIFHEECLHGLAARGATSFPQPIAVAASFDTDLIEDVYAATAREARSRGTHQALTPVLDVARDPRWGRVEETFGEDPYLTAQMGLAAVRGFQNPSDHILATLKHFAAHGEPEGGMNCAPAHVSERELREVFLYPFEQAIRIGGAASVMASYNEIDGVPSHANAWLLRDVLRGEWGFGGFVVSDYYAICELHERPETHGHHVAADGAGACALAVEAGVNIELPDPDCYEHLSALGRSGTLDESQLDALVRPMLIAKFRMGLFDDPYVDPERAERINGFAEHAKLALRAARESITLLKNEGDILPLEAARTASSASASSDTKMSSNTDPSPKTVGSLAVIGPNADRVLLGGYSGLPPHFVTVLDGIRERAGGDMDVRHAEGCKLTAGGTAEQDEVPLADPEIDRKLIAGAAEAARASDVAILALGGNEQTARESWSRSHLGDRARLDLFGRQQELVEAVAATGTPIVTLLFGGRPLAVPKLDRLSAAMLQCWYLGQETGRAVADILFGDVNPSGKLPISMPRSAGHLPVYYNHKPSARRGYLHDDAAPLYPFGFGRSYTSFAVENIRLDNETIAASSSANSGAMQPDERKSDNPRRPDSTRVLADVTNTGNRHGAEVVQMYIRDCISSVTRPVKELKGIVRCTLAPGETQTVALAITPDRLAFYDIHMNRVVEPGEFEIMVGTSSRAEDLQSVILSVET